MGTSRLAPRRRGVPDEKLSFIVWILVTGIHVLAYSVRAGDLGLADFIGGCPCKRDSHQRDGWECLT